MARKPTLSGPASEIMGGCYAGRIRLLSRAITGVYDDALRDVGVTAGQLTTLSFVERLGPIAPGVLAKELAMEKSTLSRNLARMERNGWVVVTEGETGRTQGVGITRRGRALIARALPAWRAAQVTTRGMLGDEGAGSIVGAFDSVRAHGARG